MVSTSAVQIPESQARCAKNEEHISKVATCENLCLYDLPTLLELSGRSRDRIQLFLQSPSYSTNIPSSETNEAGFYKQLHLLHGPDSFPEHSLSCALSEAKVLWKKVCDQIIIGCIRTHTYKGCKLRLHRQTYYWHFHIFACLTAH